MPKPDDARPHPTPAPVTPATLPPDFPDIGKIRVPSCSRLLRLPRPQTGLRAARCCGETETQGVMVGLSGATWSGCSGAATASVVKGHVRNGPEGFPSRRPA